jgi:amino acid transporter
VELALGLTPAYGTPVSTSRGGEAMTVADADARPSTRQTDRRVLRRELGLAGAIAVAIGFMTPTGSVALNGQLPATLVGRAVPLSFVFAGIGAFFVAFGFMRLTQHFSHAGSVYAFTGATLGPQAGFFSGWALLGCYLVYTASVTVLLSVFAGAFLEGIGVGHVDWLILALIGLTIGTALARMDVRAVVRWILGFEGFSVTIVLILTIVIFARLIGGNPPEHQTFTLSVFSLPHGVQFSAIGLASVAGILSYAGFEAAGSMGEETRNPKRNIPWAIMGALGIVTIFYIVVISAQSMGFGVDAGGVKAFGSSASPLADLAHTYVGKSMEDVINFGAMISALGGLIGVLAAGGRLLFAFDRDGLFGGGPLSRVSATTGEPTFALTASGCLAALILIAMRLGGTQVNNVYFYLGTIGTLSLLVAYLMTTIGAWKYLQFDSPRRRVIDGTRLMDFLFPIIGVIVVCYILYRQLHPTPPHPYNLFPYMVAGWLIAGLAFVCLMPGMARKIGQRLASELARDDSTPVDAHMGEQVLGVDGGQAAVAEPTEP